VRVALKSIKGVDSVNVSLEKGEAVATFVPGNSVRYSDLLRAIEKNGFVVKGSKIVADGRVTTTGAGSEFEVSGSGDRFQLKPAAGATASISRGGAEITGEIPEVGKGKSADVLIYSSVVSK
jgi:copper chaperone CopZ